MKKSTRVTKKKKIETRVKKASTVKAKADGDKGFSVSIYNSKGKEVEKFDLSKEIFTGEVNKAVLYQAILMYNANQRQGNASTKTRGDVSGGGKKPFRQKGTGRARAGSTRSPLWRHGGTVFGPHTRDYSYSLPRKIRRLAFLSSLNSKLNEEKVMGLDTIELAVPKTKNFKAIMSALKLVGSTLFVTDVIDHNVLRASRNLREVSVKNYKDINTIDVLKHDNLVMSKTALEKLSERFKGEGA
ncbi:MAG: 50S ribosomal protein L4 [Candidatus Omnitrophota bacterium]|jgi:large subunit ribosomal protein L4